MNKSVVSMFTNSMYKKLKLLNVIICRFYAANHLVPIYKCIFYTFAYVYVVVLFCIRKKKKENM